MESLRNADGDLDMDQAMIKVDAIPIGRTGPSIITVCSPNLPAIHGLCDLATIVLVPTGTTRDDLDSVLPWMAALLDAGTRAAFVLNKANRRTSSFTKYRARLIKAGPICPIEIPTLEDIHTQSDNGLTVLDIVRSKGHEPMEGLWAFAQRETTAQ